MKITADDFLHQVHIFGGAVVRVEDCTPEQIQLAQASDACFVDGRGFVYIRMPREWTVLAMQRHHVAAAKAAELTRESCPVCSLYVEHAAATCNRIDCPILHPQPPEHSHGEAAFGHATVRAS